ncbi:MAG TPA: clostripain-related cysteine peptidase, partial [Magnetospirillum sp.]|nr:clostripain-related cysteine peptidase [Magnetospirillum sp.]
MIRRWRTGGTNLSADTVLARAARAVDIDDTIDTTGTLAVGGRVTSAIDTPTDEDWFKVTLRAGTTYTFNLRGVDGSGGTLSDPSIIGIYNANGDITPGTANDDYGDTLDSRVTFKPTTSGVYYIGVGGYYYETGTYTLSLSGTTTTTPTVSADVPDNTTTTATVAVGGTYQGNIYAASDKDWIKVSLVAGRTYSVSNVGSTLAAPKILGVFTANGLAVPDSASASGSGSTATSKFSVAQSGTYYVAVGSDTSGIGNYALRVTQVTDTVAPLLMATTPTDNLTGVRTTPSITLSFNELVKAGSGNIVLTGGGQTRTIAVTDTSQVTVSGQTVTIRPTTALIANTDYSVTMAAGVIKDTTGNNFAGITSTTTLNFKTNATNAANTWTLMVYVDGDNNLEAEALADLNEMESINLNGTRVKVVVEVDRCTGYDATNGNWTNTKHGVIGYDSANSGTLVSSLTNVSSGTSELNMGAPSTLTSFINWAAANNPANNYGLVIWDHGGGIDGAAWDDTNNNDNLTIAEIRNAIAASTVSHFGLVGFDACLMGMAEIQAQLASQCDVFVGSEELEPGEGWDYNAILASLKSNPNSSAISLGNNIVSSYGQYYAGQQDITLSAITTQKMAALQTAIRNFVNTSLGAGITAADWTGMRNAATSARPMPSDESCDFADLGDFMKGVALRVSNATLKTLATRVVAAIDNAVLSQSGTDGAASGISIYLPTYGETVRSDYTATASTSGGNLVGGFSFVAATHWDQYL